MQFDSPVSVTWVGSCCIHTVSQDSDPAQLRMHDVLCRRCLKFVWRVAFISSSTIYHPQLAILVHPQTQLLSNSSQHINDLDSEDYSFKFGAKHKDNVNKPDNWKYVSKNPSNEWSHEHVSESHRIWNCPYIFTESSRGFENRKRRRDHYISYSSSSAATRARHGFA